jgi:uncharacterized repeat protein (TIGR01451 family)
LTLALLSSALLVGLTLPFVATPPPLAQASGSVTSNGIMMANVFYAYVRGDESLAVAAQRGSITVTSPTGATSTGAGTRAAIGTAGVWRISVNNGTSKTAGTWTINVLRGGTPVSGRVWTESYVTNQSARRDLTYWAVNLNGFVYRIDLGATNGAYSRITADAIGNPVGNECRPSYASRDFAASYGDAWFPPMLECGSRFKIFFELPDPELPVEAQTAPGQTTWILPPPITRDGIEVSDFAFAQAEGTSAGLFTWAMDKFMGNYELQIDVDNNGSYTDPIDRRIDVSGGPGDYNQTFDGRDGQGQTIAFGIPLTARLWFDKTGEFHLVMDDIEERGSITLTRLNGDGAPDATLYWNDTPLSTSGYYPTPQLDGRAGVDSTYGVHGWGSSRSWGESRSIEDWTYAQPLDASRGEMEIGIVPVDSAKSAIPSSTSPVLPGQRISYSLDFTGSLDRAVLVDTSDSLAGLLDDASLVSEPVASPGLSVGPVGPDGSFSITGSVQPGQTASVTYQVQVNQDATGDDQLVNVLFCDQYQIDCQPRQTTHSVARIDLEHDIDNGGDPVLNQGDQVTLEYRVTNTGQVDLSDITIETSSFSGSGPLGPLVCASSNLAPGQSTDCTRTYALTQTDVDLGSIASNAQASAMTPLGAAGESAQEVWSPSLWATLPSQSNPSLRLDSTVGQLPSQPTELGQPVTYEFSIANNGNVSISDVGVESVGFSGAPPLAVVCPDTSVTPLAPRTSLTCSATYQVTQADIDRGFLNQSAQAVGADPALNRITSLPSAANLTLNQAGSLRLSQSADLPADGFSVGTPVMYRFDVTNTGNVTISGLAIQEQAFSGSGAIASITCPTTTLAPGLSTRCQAVYVIRQADVDAAVLNHTAIAIGSAPATAQYPTGRPISSSPASSRVAGERSPALDLVVNLTQVDQTLPLLGQTIGLSFQVTNSGNVSVSGVEIDQREFSGSPYPVVTCPQTVNPALAPGASIVCQAEHALTQADLDLGQFNHESIALAEAAGGQSVESNLVGVGFQLTQTGQLALQLQADGSTLSTWPEAGQSLRFNLTATNTGNVTLADLTIADSLSQLGVWRQIWPETTGSLAPGQTMTAWASYQLTQADLDAGSLTDSATISGLSPQAIVVTSPPAVASLALAGQAALHLEKWLETVSPPDPPMNAGDPLSYGFAVTNTGNVTLHDVGISDPLLGQAGVTWSGWPGTPGQLAPGQEARAQGSLTVSQADVDAGLVHNDASPFGLDPFGQPVGQVNQASAEYNIPAVDRLALTSSVDTSLLSSPPQAGQQLTFSFTIRDIGNTTLYDVALSDPLPGLGAIVYDWPDQPGQLVPGQQAAASATYVLTQADLDAGQLSNPVTASGWAPQGYRTPEANAITTVALTASSALSLTKSADVSGLSDPPQAGQTIVYHFALTNTGNLTVHAAAIADPLPGLTSLVYDWPQAGPAGLLAPGQTATAQASYQLTQADLDSGQVASKAVSSGTNPDGGAVPAPGQASASTVLAAAPGLALEQWADTSRLTAPPTAGQPLGFDFTATNVGNVSLTQVTLSDPLPGLGALVYDWPGAPGHLAPGQSVTVRADYSLTQADIDAGQVVNRATAGAQAPDGANLAEPPQAEATVSLAPAPALRLTKASDSSELSVPPQAGQTVTYDFVVTNVGNVTATGVAIVDPLPGLSALTHLWPGPAGVLTPGQSATARATYQLTQADLDAGQLVNAASADGRAPDGSALPSPAQAGDRIVLTPAGAVGLTLTADSSQLSDPPVAGQTVTYLFSATNTGNVTLRQLVLVDPLPGLDAPTHLWPGPPGQLAPGQTVTARADYRLTQADIDRGQLTNDATVEGLTPVGLAVQPAQGSAVVALAPAARLELSKQADTSQLSDPPQAGQTVTYRFTVVNTGNVSVHRVAVVDPLDGLSDLDYVWPGPTGQLAPGQSVTAQATYRLTQADLDRGQLSSTATAEAEGPDQSVLPETPSASLTTPLTAAPQLGLGRGVYRLLDAPLDDRIGDDPADRAEATSPQEIVYLFEVRNLGNVTVYDVSLSHRHFDGARPTPTVTCPDQAAALAPGQFVVCSARYLLSQADVDAGEVVSRVQASGQPAGGQVPPTLVSSEVSALIASPHQPALTVEVASSLTETADYVLGATVEFTFWITNTGNVTLSDPAIEVVFFNGQSALDQIVCPTDDVAPGGSIVCQAEHVLAQGDIDARRIDLTVAAQGDSPGSRAVGGLPVTTVPSLSAATFAQGAHQPSLSLVKSSSAVGQDSLAVGDEVTYSFVVRNTGNVTMSAISLTDDDFSGFGPLSDIDCPQDQLGPEQSMTCQATYIVEQEDVDAGVLTNHAVVTGLSPIPLGEDDPVEASDQSQTALPALAEPSLDLVQTGSRRTDGPASLGEIVDYRFVVLNTGNVTVTELTVLGLSFSGAGPLSDVVCQDTVLRPGQSTECQATYALTATEVAQGGVLLNQAVASGLTPLGETIDSLEAEAEIQLPLPPTGAPAGLGAWVAAAGLCFLLGCLLVLVARRRRTD